MKRLICLLLLIPSLCHAGPAAKRMMSVMATSVVYEAFTINGFSAIDSEGTTDTGTQSIATGAGKITVNVSCDYEEGDSTVSLYVDGVVGPSAELECEEGVGPSGGTLISSMLSAGNHDVRVTGTGFFSADTFMKPKP